MLSLTDAQNSMIATRPSWSTTEVSSTAESGLSKSAKMSKSEELYSVTSAESPGRQRYCVTYCTTSSSSSNRLPTYLLLLVARLRLKLFTHGKCVMSSIYAH